MTSGKKFSKIILFFLRCKKNQKDLKRRFQMERMRSEYCETLGFGKNKSLRRKVGERERR